MHYDYDYDNDKKQDTKSVLKTQGDCREETWRAYKIPISA
jgi:hypothetical protein